MAGEGGDKQEESQEIINGDEGQRGGEKTEKDRKQETELQGRVHDSSSSSPEPLLWRFGKDKQP